MFAPHAALRLQHLKRVHVRGHFRTLSEARDVSTSSPLLFSPFSLAALAVHQHYSTIHQRKWKHSAISHSAQFGTSFGMSIIKKYIVKQNFIVCSSGDDCSESNMQSGKDNEDLQKALALSLEPLEDRTGAELGSLLTCCKKGFRHESAEIHYP